MRVKLMAIIMMFLCAGLLVAHEVNLSEPLNGTITSDEYQIIVYNFTFPATIDQDSIVLNVGGTDYTLADPELRWLAPNLVFTPATPYADGQLMEDTLTYQSTDTVFDTVCNVPGSLVVDTITEFQMTSCFWVDISGPYMVNRTPGDANEVTPFISNDTLQPIEIFIHDETGEIDLSTVIVRIEGVNYGVAHPGLTFEENYMYIDPVTSDTTMLVRLLFDPVAAGISFNKTDTVEISLLAADDLPDYDYGAPNHLQDLPINDWEFYIDVVGPQSSILYPYAGAVTYVACIDQEIALRVWDANGINPSSIQVEIEGRIYTPTHPRADFDSTTGIFTYTPYPFWASGQTVDVELLTVEDIYGNGIADAHRVVWSFIVDRESPILTNYYPPDGYVTTDVQEPVWFQVEDAVGFVNGQSIELVIETSSGSRWEWNGYYTGFGAHIPGISWDGTTYEFDPAVVGSTYAEGDTVYVTLTNVSDSVHYCESNRMTGEYNWQFYISSGPSVDIVYPLNGTFTDCEHQVIRFNADDPDGVDYSTLVLRVEGVDYDTSTIIEYYDTTVLPGTTLIDTYEYHPLTVNANEVTFNPLYLPRYVDGQEINVALIALQDAGCGYSVANLPLRWSFIVDRTGAHVEEYWPFNAVSGAYPVIKIFFVDSICGDINPDFTTVIVNGRRYLPTVNAGTYFSDDTLMIDMAVEGRSFADGEEIEVCVTHAYDDLDYRCSPFGNALRNAPFCWTFTVDYEGVNIVLVEPAEGSYTACEEQQVIINITDESGVDENSILFESEGHLYDVSSPYLNYLRPENNLVFTPPTPYSDGEVVEFALIEVADSVGNMTGGSPLISDFLVDLAPPEVLGTNPEEDEVVCSELTEIGIEIYDINPFDTNSAQFDLTVATEGDTDNYSFSYAGGRIQIIDGVAWLNIAGAVEFAGSTVVTVDFSITDMPEYECGNYNELNYSYSFSTNPGWEVDIIVEDSDSTHILTFGAQLGATPGYDPFMDWQAPPPLDTTSITSVTFSNSGYNLIKDIKGLSGDSLSWRIYVPKGISGTLYWDPADVPTFANFIINGTVDMKSTNSYSFSGSQWIIINFKGSMITLYKGWNLVSVPVTPNHPSTNSVFPSAVGAVFTYNSQTKGFGVATKVEPGKAYFVLHMEDTAAGYPETYSYSIAGTPVDEVTVRIYDGWNTFGTPYNFGEISTKDIDEYPSGGILWSLLYEYNTGIGNYKPVSSVTGGKGYYVYGSVPYGFSYVEITISSDGAMKSVTFHEAKEQPEGYLKLQAGTQDLTVGVDERATKVYNDNFDCALPPAIEGFGGAYIADKELGRMVTDIRDKGLNNWPLVIDADAPMTVTCEELSAPNGYEFTVELNGKDVLLESGNELRLTPSTYTISLRKATTLNSLASELDGCQNIPNPFSEKTTILYQLPEESMVKLNVFDILGNRVATLVNDVQAAGEKAVTWDGNDAEPGIYYYHLEIDGQSFTNKMLLTK